MTKPPTYSTDDLFFAIVVPSVFLFAGAVFWWVLHPDLVYWSFRCAWLVLESLDWGVSHKWIGPLRAELAQAAGTPGAVPFSTYAWLLQRTGFWFCALPLAATAALAWKALQHPALKTRRAITADTLPWVVSTHSPAVIPSLYYPNLLKSDPPEHRSALNPEEYAASRRLVINGVLDRERAVASLETDLGPALTSLTELEPHERALFAVFAARVMSTSDDLGEAQVLLDALNRSCHQGSFDGRPGYPQFEVASTAFEKYADHPDVPNWIARHPFRRTLLASMHEAAIKSGKLSSSHFRWLKGVDRPLWYALNTTGRKTPFAESLAVFTQQRWETFSTALSANLSKPHLEDAVDALEAYLFKVGVVTTLNKKAMK
jgi:intracellular multiplication protein IcmP